jgi:predicted amidohydrolase YtcJ
MVTRETAKASVQGPEYAVDRYTALHLSTLAGAELNGDRRWAGSLVPGKFGDIAAFGEGPVTCPVDRPLEIRPRFTLLAGELFTIPTGC